MLTLLIIAVSVVVVLIIICIIRMYQKSTNAMCTSQKILDGKVAIVTGGTAGMGFEIARDYARRGAKVIIACPFEEEGLSARNRIAEETENSNIVFKLLNLGSLQSVREFAAEILTTEVRLDVLMNNAGVALPQDFLTEDGMNAVMQINFYGHFLLTILLLPLLKKTGKPTEPSRVVFTSSISHYLGKIESNIDNMNKKGYYWLPVAQYANSKFCVVPFSRELTQRLRSSNVVINSVDPGAVGTGIYKAGGIIYSTIAKNLFYYLYKTPWEGAQTALYVTLDDKAGEVSGEFFKNCKQSRARASAYEDKPAARLWEDTVRRVKLTNEDLETSFKLLNNSEGRKEGRKEEGIFVIQAAGEGHIQTTGSPPVMDVTIVVQ